jgi:dihydrofolate reductase
MITLIASIGRNNELGLGNKLLWNITEDMKHFKSYTMGKVIIMGSNTLLSIGKCLPGRKSIVLSSKGSGGLAITAHSIEDILSIEHCYSELVIIGGASVYKQTIEIANKLVITHIDAESNADVFFPMIDPTIWKINNTVDSNNELYNYKFVEYVKDESIGNIK